MTQVCRSRGISFGGKLSVRYEEIQLLEDLVVGDHSAWRLFVERYQGTVYARIVRTSAECGRKLSAADAEDICAEVFASLVADNFASLRRFEGRSKLSTWLSVVARRICLKRLHAKSATTGMEDWTEHPESPRHSNTLAAMIALEDAQRVRQNMSCLSAGDQEVLHSYFSDGLSYQQIAEKLSVSINTVGPKIHRALQRLKRLLMDETPERSEQA